MKRIFAHIGFSVAVSLFIFNIFGIGFTQYAGIVLATIFVAGLILPDFRKKAAVPLCSGSALFACLLFVYCYYNVALPQLSLGGREADAVFYITGFANKSNTGFVYNACVQSVNIDSAPQNIKIKLYTNEQIPAACYQLVEGKLKFFSSGSSGYSSYGMWGNGFFVNAKVGSYTRTDEFVPSVMTGVLSVREYIMQACGSYIGGDEGALSLGVLLGDRSQFSDELVTAFKMTGTMHLTAVSGLHLGAATGFFAYIFRRLGVSKKVSSPILIIIILLYGLLSGFSKSVLRAGVMLFVVLAGEMAGKRADSLNSLGIAMFVICLNPFAVCDLSALLTALCVFAIIVVYPAFSLRYSRDTVLLRQRLKGHGTLSNNLLKIAFSVADLLILSVSITVCTMPVMCLFFGYFSTVGILISPIIMFLGTAVVIASMIFAICSPFRILAVLTALFVRLINSIVLNLITSAAKLPFATLNLTKETALAIGGVLIFLGICTAFFPNRLKSSALSAVAVLAVLIVTFNISDSRASHIYFTENAAAVVSSKEVAVLNVRNRHDYIRVRAYLTSNRLGVDGIYNCDSEFADLLADEFNCHSITHTKSAVAFEVDGITFSSGSGAKGNIVLYNGVLTDSAGSTDLADGEVIYSVKGDAYSVSRYSSSMLT
ncbi:MAG: ComEC/Rec2 family competence protein [Ruminococcaceae bacterium]|nr:ComEC/Rec2 family competence protein [Oscillospiraceae bacterium]